MENSRKIMKIVCVEIFDWYTKCFIANGRGSSINHNISNCTQNVWSLNSENFENVSKIYICCKPIKHQKWVKSERNKVQMEFSLPKRNSQNEH